MDGIEAAEQIQAQSGIPVVFLTAHADDRTLQRAKITGPFGYVIKPFETRDLRIAIEMALYKHEMEKKLREREERYRTVSELVSDLAYAIRIDPEGGLALEWVTEAHTRITGYTPEEAPPALADWNDLVHPDDLSIAVEHMGTLLKGQPDVSEYRIIAKDGETRWIRNYGRPVWDETQERTVCIYGAVQDISEQKQAEETLRRQALIFENLHDAVLVSDSQGHITDWNPAATRMYGYSREEMLGRTAEILNTPKGPITVTAEILDGVGRDNRWSGEIEFVRQDGTEGISETVVFPLLDEHGDQVAVVGVNHDITARKRAEETLQRRNRELALLNQAGQELSATLDAKQVLEQVLRAVTEITGAEGASVWLWDEGRVELICQAALPRGQEHSSLGLRVPPGQGIVGWVAEQGRSTIVADAGQDARFYPRIDEQTGFHTTSLLAAPLRVRDAAVGVLEVVNKRQGDFDTDDLALVETLSASAAIAIENAHLVEALRQHADELEASNRELDAFAHTVAHDLKSPLSNIIGYAEVLKEDCASLPVEEMQEYLERLLRSGRKMSNIIRELLLLAEVREVEAWMEPLAMGPVVGEALRRLAYSIKEHQGQIICPETWPVAQGHGPWVEEVWANYISNGIKYGGEPPRVELGAQEQADGTVRFWVRDNGRGIPTEELSRLFAPFTQLGQVRALGHGLGLSIVQRIVEKLGGQVGVESEVGQGSVFSFTLPGADDHIQGTTKDENSGARHSE
jgi:PAS domain S-box-containing protein